MRHLKEKIVNWLSNYSENNKFKFVVGISGGIDSAIVSTLCCLTGIETHVVSIPIKQNCKELTRARNHINWLKNNFCNVVDHEYDLTDIFEIFKKSFRDEYLTNHSLANTRSRMRMVVLYQLAGAINGIVVGTGNKIEDFGIGFFTKYGDGAVDISPIADLTKTEVREMAKELDILNEILIAAPTDGLWEDDRTDEDQIKATYEELEWAMNFESNPEDLIGRQREVYFIYSKFNLQNKHKMISIPIFKK